MKEEFNSRITVDAMKVMSGKYAKRTTHTLFRVKRIFVRFKIMSNYLRIPRASKNSS